MALTLEEVQAIITVLKDALTTVAEGKEYWMNGQRYMTEDMDKISSELMRWIRVETGMLRQQQGNSKINYSRATFA